MHTKMAAGVGCAVGQLADTSYGPLRFTAKPVGDSTKIVVFFGDDRAGYVTLDAGNPTGGLIRSLAAPGQLDIRLTN
jgi:hypothetical protein